MVAVATSDIAIPSNDCAAALCVLKLQFVLRELVESGMHARSANGVMHIYLTLKLITVLPTLVRRLPPTLSTRTLAQRVFTIGDLVHIEFHWNLASIRKTDPAGKLCRNTAH